MHHVFVKKNWLEQFKSCGVDASCFYQQESSLKVAVSMHHVFPNRNWSSLKVLMSMHHVFVKKNWLEQFKSGGVNVSCLFQQESSLKVAVAMHHFC